MTRRRSFTGVLLLCLLVVVGGVEGLLPNKTFAQPAPLEYQVKAAFLYQFSKFVEWPPQAFSSNQYTICIGVIDGGPMVNALQSIEGKETKGRRVAVKRFKAPDELEFCHILYISSSLESRLTAILDRLKGSSTLTVSDIGGFARRGGMIGLINVDGKVHFEINPDTAQKANLQISSHLLRLAQIVSGER